MGIGLNLKKVKFGPDSKDIIEQVNDWVKIDKTDYVKRRLFKGGDGDFAALVEDSLGARLRLQEAYAYLCDGAVVGVAFTSSTIPDVDMPTNVNITTICANPEDPHFIIESEIIDEIKHSTVKKYTRNIFADISYVNKDLVRAFAENGFIVSREQNIIHVECQLQPQYEHTR